MSGWSARIFSWSGFSPRSTACRYAAIASFTRRSRDDGSSGVEDMNWAQRWDVGLPGKQRRRIIVERCGRICQENQRIWRLGGARKTVYAAGLLSEIHEIARIRALNCAR